MTNREADHEMPDCPRDGSWRLILGAVVGSDGHVIATVDRVNPDGQHVARAFTLCRDQANALLAGKQIGLV